jgi:hypothetical protein
VEHPEDGEGRADGVARLHRHEAGHAALGVRLHQPRRVVHEGQVLRVLHDDAFDQVDLLQRDLDGVTVLRAARRVRYPKLKNI